MTGRRHELRVRQWFGERSGAGHAGPSRQAVAALVCTLSTAAQAAPAGPEPDFRGQPASAEVRALARWAAVGGDAGGRAFVIVAKRDAQIFVFNADGRLAGSAPVLLGQAPGDASSPGVGRRVTTGIAPAERTTPAGRFDAEPGHNDRGEAIVWVDYDTALAIHRLRPAPASQRRPQRLASPTPLDNRITLGCIVVAERFYDEVVAPTLGRTRSVVYVVPESGGVASLVGASAGN